MIDLNRANNNTRASILIVDDEPKIRTIVSRWFTDAGYLSASAENVNSAWNRLEKEKYDLVTLDINMPGRSGLDLLASIKQRLPDIEVIMLTSRAEVETAVKALTAGAYGYLIKPVAEDELLIQTERALKHRQLVIESQNYTRNLEEKVATQTLEIRRAHEETIHRLVTASMFRDRETGAHIKRTGLYSEFFAKVLGWSMKHVEEIRMAAPMHDVGKVAIPDAILQKPGKLTADEFELMKTHTTIGAKILTGSTSPMLQMAREIAFCHHERWDGNGYPQGLSGMNIPDSARIVAIIDVFDALIHKRVYHSAMEKNEAITLMKQERGKHFDPDLFDIFLTILPELQQIANDHPNELCMKEMTLSLET